MSLAAHTTSTIIPCLRYQDAPAAIEWLCRAFGFQKHAVYADGAVVHHAQLVFGNGMIMLGSADNRSEWGRQIVQPQEVGLRETQSPCV
ncbi:MAG: glyoxalase, partial [Pseudoxanthomonas sp.]